MANFLETKNCIEGGKNCLKENLGGNNYKKYLEFLNLEAECKNKLSLEQEQIAKGLDSSDPLMHLYAQFKIYEELDNPDQLIDILDKLIQTEKDYKKIIRFGIRLAYECNR